MMGKVTRAFGEKLDFVMENIICLAERPLLVEIPLCRLVSFPLVSSCILPVPFSLGPVSGFFIIGPSVLLMPFNNLGLDSDIENRRRLSP